MKILVTGANGFIGKNLVSELKKKHIVFEYTRSSTREELNFFCKECEFIFHLAGVQRPEKAEEFIKGNYELTEDILLALKYHKNPCSLMFSSSIQAELNNDYGISKKLTEDLLFSFEKETDAQVFIYRFNNIFGKWGRPNFNSAVTTFCYNTANHLPITINDPSKEMNLIYIDDVINEMVNILEGKANKKNNFCYVQPVYKVTLGQIVCFLGDFKKKNEKDEEIILENEFMKKLHATYLSYTQ